MKRFRFKLDSVLTLYGFQKNRAAAALAEVQRRRIGLVEELNEALQTQLQFEETLRVRCRKSASAADLIRVQDALAQQRIHVDECNKQLQLAFRKEDQCREVVLSARQREETILKLREKQKERFRREQDRADERAVDEFVSARHHLRNLT